MKRSVDHKQGQVGRHPKKQRKQRPCYSCEECRRLKMKCDRQVTFPCSNCVRRHRSELCNAQDAVDSRGQSRENATSTETTKAPADLTEEPAMPREYGAMNHQRRTSPPPISSIVDTQARLQRSSSSASCATQMQPPNAPDVSTGGSNPGGLPPCPDNQSALGHLALLDQALQINATLQTSPPLVAAAGAGATQAHMTKHLHTAFTTTDIGVRQEERPKTDDDVGGGYGTLVLTRSGRSEYLGPTAACEWLKDSETDEFLEGDDPITRPPTPRQSSSTAQPGNIGMRVAFPFNESSARVSTHELLAQLPPREESWTLVESYYRYCAWHYDVAPRMYFQKTFDRVYALCEGEPPSPSVNAQEIALVFIILALGTLFNIELPHFDPSAEFWLHLSERALVKGEFLSNNTLAGIQTLHLMAHVQLHLDKGHRGESAWPLWGLVMRQVQAMGMHRDGSRWNLPEEVVEERRKVFWEVQAQDMFQAHCFSRPAAINPEHCDTEFPNEPSLNSKRERGYSILRYELSQISSDILNMVMRVRKPPYTDVLHMDMKLCEFERNIPFALRSRTALLSMPSRYLQGEDAIKASPEPSPRSVTLSFHQMNLALNVCETVINLHRPYYAQALYDQRDPVESMYAPSYLTVIERCVVLINLVQDIHSRFPSISTRQWNFWYHVFGSVLCLSTLVFRDARNPLASVVLTQIDVAIGLFTSLIQLGAATPRYQRNLQWMLKLRKRVASKIEAATKATNAGHSLDPHEGGEGAEGGEDSDDIELLGWRTRLIEQAGRKNKTVRTIGVPSSTNDSPATNMSHTSPDKGTQDTNSLAGLLNHSNHLLPDPPILHSSFESPDSASDLLRDFHQLRDFWDPMFVQDIFEGPQEQLEQPTVGQWPTEQ